MPQSGRQTTNAIMRRPVTRSQSTAQEQSRCNLCCREIIAVKSELEASNGKKPRSRWHKVACTSFIPRSVFEAGIMKRWHSDSSDAEEDEGHPPPPKKTCAVAKKGCAVQCQRAAAAELAEAEKTPDSVAIPELPDEMWLKVFALVLSSGGHYPTMHRLQLVCSRWLRLCRHSTLWRDVDLSCAGTRWIPYRDSTLEWLSKHRFDRLQSINLHGWHCLSAKGLEHVATHCPRLTTVNLAFCTHVHQDAIFTLTEHCKELSHLNLANTSSFRSDIVSVDPMVHLAKVSGRKLRSLDLSGNLLHGFNTILKAICDNCPNLAELDVGRCRGDLLNMDIELWQHCLPRMKKFSLSYSIFTKVQIIPCTRCKKGWPWLEELCLAMSTAGGTKMPPPICDDLLKRFLCNSRRLKKLDVRGCAEISGSMLLRLPLPDLRILELGVVSDAEQYEQHGLSRLMAKHGSHLEEVNLSWTSYSQKAMRQAVQTLIRTQTDRLRLLFLARALITPEDLRDIVTLRPKVARIELKDCPNLPPEWRKLFNSESKIARLHKMVKTHMERKRKEREKEEEEEEAKKKIEEEEAKKKEETG